MRLVNLITVQHLDPYWYQKVLDRYKIGLLEWSSKDIDDTKMNLTIIDLCRGLVNTTPSPTRSSIISVSEYRQKNPMHPQIVKSYQSFTLPHKLSQERIKAFLEENK